MPLKDTETQPDEDYAPPIPREEVVSVVRKMK
jgi:hypothetical protein